jgi:membrane dipeptidase
VCSQSHSEPLGPARPLIPILMDGHVHITNRVFWEGIDPWQAQERGEWDYARARAAGVNVIIDNIAPYGFEPYNGTVKQVLRLIERFHRTIEANADKMALALGVDDVRRIVASDRLAVILSTEAGFDQEGDVEVIAALYRLGLRAVQFTSKSSLNAYADVSIPGHPRVWGGINQRGRDLVREMNRLGIVIDLAHASEEAQLQIIEASAAPVVNSHDALAAVSGRGICDMVLKAIAAKGGLVGIHGASEIIGRRYIEWVGKNPTRFQALRKPIRAFSTYQPGERPFDDRGDYITRLDSEFRAVWNGVFEPWEDDPEAASLAADAQEWAQHIQHVIDVVGPDHVAIGLDMFGARSGIRGMNGAGGYQLLVCALQAITTPDNVRKITGENWMRVLADVARMRRTANQA